MPLTLEDFAKHLEKSVSDWPFEDQRLHERLCSDPHILPALIIAHLRREDLGYLIPEFDMNGDWLQQRFYTDISYALGADLSRVGTDEDHYNEVEVLAEIFQGLITHPSQTQNLHLTLDGKDISKLNFLSKFPAWMLGAFLSVAHNTDLQRSVVENSFKKNGKAILTSGLMKEKYRLETLLGLSNLFHHDDQGTKYDAAIQSLKDILAEAKPFLTDLDRLDVSLALESELRFLNRLSEVSAFSIPPEEFVKAIEATRLMVTSFKDKFTPQIEREIQATNMLRQIFS